MSRSMRRNRVAAQYRVEKGGDGRVMIIRKDSDCNVSCSKPCYMCEKHSKPKLLLHIKPRRRLEQEELRRAVLEE